MKQSCNVCGKIIETGGYGGLPMKQHYKNKHPEEYYSEDDEEHPQKLDNSSKTLEEFT